MIVKPKMCYNQEASLISYIVGTVCTLLLFRSKNRYNRHIALFSLAFIQMQLTEYFMWTDQECGKTNHYATIVGHFILISQPLAVLYGAYKYQTLAISSKKLMSWIFLALVPLINTVIVHLITNRQLCTEEQFSGHLLWDFPMDDSYLEQLAIFHGTVYMTLLFVPWLYMKDQYRGIMSFVIMVTTLIFGMLGEGSFMKEWKSKWCYVAVIYPLFFNFVNWLGL